MKKTYSLLLFVLLGYARTSEVNAQALMEVNGTVPLSVNSPTIVTGGGVGFGIYSQPIELFKPSYKQSGPPLSLRFGGYFHYNGAGQKTFSSVPLLSGTGNASVNFSNSLMGLNMSAKLSSSLLKGKLIPYGECYLGLRYFSSDLNIDPNDENEKSNSYTLTKTSGLNIGAAGGMMIKLTDAFFIDTGVMWSHSELNGEFVDVRSLKRIGTSIGYHTEKLPNDFLVFKLGLTGYIGALECSGSGNGDGWGDFFEILFDCVGSGGGGGGGGGNIGLIKF